MNDENTMSPADWHKYELAKFKEASDYFENIYGPNFVEHLKDYITGILIWEGLKKETSDG